MRDPRDKEILTDFYLDDYNVIKRLTRTWLERKTLIIAYDFDDTVSDYYKRGLEFTNVIDLLKKCKTIGAYFIVFTCRVKEDEPDIIAYLKHYDIPFDAINENMPGMFETGRKIYYNILLDDKAGLSSAYHCLSVAAGNIESLKGHIYEEQ